VQNLKPYQDVIADSVVTVMMDCPIDDSATRKELLVATRHILYTDFRQPFLKHIDALLSEDVIVGKGLTSRETLRYLLIFCLELFC
jgi:transformation/transcription domain-associated protein